MSKPNLATEALQKTYSLKRGSPAAAIKMFKEFTSSFEKVAPDGQFSVQDVRSWYEAYRELTPTKEGVDTFANSYALGRFMKQNQVKLGIHLLGTYGNRHVYEVRPTPKSKFGGKS